MILEIIQILKLDDWYGVSKNVDIAKGVHQTTTSVKEAIKIANRKRKAKLDHGH